MVWKLYQTPPNWRNWLKDGIRIAPLPAGISGAAWMATPESEIRKACIRKARPSVFIGRELTLPSDAHDQELLLRAQSGDRAAFASILHENKGMVYSVAYHFLRDPALAEEIAQDIFLDLFRNLRVLQSQVHVTAWLRRSTINRCIDQSRKRAYRNEAQLSYMDEPAAADHYPDVFAHEALRRQIAALPEEQRAAIILRYGESLMPEEIAELLNIPVNSVKSRLARALQTLRRKLASQRELTR